MVTSAGLVLIHNNKILLVHPTGSKWYGTYSIPKGHLEENEDALTAAVRETQEEIGVQFSPDEIELISEGYIDYKTSNGVVYKRVIYYVVYLLTWIAPGNCTLQLDEVDWVGWLTKDEAEKRIFWRLKNVLQYLK